jgi:hypothetical protein
MVASRPAATAGGSVSPTGLWCAAYAPNNGGISRHFLWTSSSGFRATCQIPADSLRTAQSAEPDQKQSAASNLVGVRVLRHFRAAAGVLSRSGQNAAPVCDARNCEWLQQYPSKSEVGPFRRSVSRGATSANPACKSGTARPYSYSQSRSRPAEGPVWFQKCVHGNGRVRLTITVRFCLKWHPGRIQRIGEEPERCQLKV